jgi:DNA-binding transcriptional LysR family regulator
MTTHEDRSKSKGSPLDDPHVLSGPFWGELRVFLAVAKAKSFNRAAEELNMSQPTVSRQVRRLQDVMGAQLVVPTQAGIRLTQQGAELARALLDLDQRLFEISSDLSSEARTAEGLVRLTAMDGMAGLFIAPNLVGLNERFPKIRIQLRAPVNFMNFRDNQTDVMIGFAPPAQGDISGRPLGFLHLIPLASRAYVERYGIPTRSNLSSHFFLQSDYYSPKEHYWDAWHALMARGVIAHSSDNSCSYALMAKAGLGIALLGSFALADPDAIPLELGVHIRLPMYALALTERMNTKPVRVVFDWLSEIFNASVPWFGPDLRLDQLPREYLAPIAARLIGARERSP